VRRLALGLLLALALVGAGIVVARARRPSLPPAPTAEDLAGLERRRDELGRKLEELIARDDQGLRQAPRGGVLVGLPTRLTSRVVDEIVTGLLRETTLTLRNLKARVSKDVKAKLIFRKGTIGHIDLEVEIHEVKGVLEPGKPALAFGSNRVDVKLPVRLARGEGRATLHAKWDSRGIANAVCGDVEVHPDVAGSVVPQDYELAGRFHFGTEGDRIVLRPEFDDLAVRIYVKPDEASWQVVEKVVEERNAVCRSALNKVDLREQLEKVLGKGFNVKIPSKIIKPIRLPGGLQKSLELQGVRFTFEAKPTGLSVTPDRLWYGADVRASGQRPRQPGVTPEPPPPPPPGLKTTRP
jgi:hypothetical protein